MRKTSLAKIFGEFNPDKHPICGPILAGDPAELVRKYSVKHERGYVAECHLCHSSLRLRKKFPEILLPDQMYGKI
jgi:hypothetical protein